MHCSKTDRYSITSSASASRVCGMVKNYDQRQPHNTQAAVPIAAGTSNILERKTHLSVRIEWLNAQILDLRQVLLGGLSV
jgi:hypothetical protein